ncbi:Sjogren's syndrome/scleroderma autoantigen 1 family protein [Halobaculum marinum]|uniref:Sjogren's syndrome/scleroderma autoantigen 1 family protein n=1 Tax=Halobaculum marinum TaxID=3031996 RepID=A0ABD5WZN6_9EURY|nr:Sjogren's syndrome/scleroderma autoantigen 1 family protein [Halobaculum sp. DT55]
MSDDVAAGDDSGFDKEAEREKLREKFARDDRKRESTRRMSELLLKGATMTNSHCDACGSPIFRQNGREFCPQCDGGGSGASASADAASADAATGDAGAAGSDAGQQTSASGASAAPPVSPSDGEDVPDGAPTGTRAPVDAAPGGSAPNGTAPAAPAATTAGDPTGAPDAATGAGDGLAAARDSLVRALGRHADAGAEATDPRTAAAHLEAAREAAEALAALRR